MKRCPTCVRGRLWGESGRLCCLLCSYVATDPITTMDRVRSNLTNIGLQEDRKNFSGLREPGDIAAALERAQRWGR